VSFVQSSPQGNNSNPAANQVQTSLNSATAIGATLVVLVSWDTTGGTQVVSTVSDGTANVYTRVDTSHDPVASQDASVYVCVNAPNSVPSTNFFLVTFNVSASSKDVQVTEGTATGAVDVHAVALNTTNAGATDGVSSGSVTTTRSGEWVVGVTASTVGSDTIAAGTGYTVRDTNTLTSDATEDQTQVAAGSIAATWTIGSGATRQHAFIVAFLPTPITHVNSASISGSGTTSATATIPGGTGILAGDLIIVCAGSQTGHVTNGISVQDAVNGVPYTTILETDLGGASSRWLQTFSFLTPVNIADGTVLTCTGYGTAVNTEFSVDIFRGATGAISQAAVGSSNATSTSSPAPALGAAPKVHDLVLTFCEAGSGTLTPGAAFTKGSSGTAGASTAIGYLLSADGVSTYASTWTLGTSNTSAAQTVAFSAPAPVADVQQGYKSTSWHPGRGPNARARFEQRQPSFEVINTQVTNDQGVGSIGFAATGTAVHKSIETGSAPVGLVAIGTARKIAIVAGTCSVGLAATGKALKLIAQTGIVTVGLAATGTATKRAPETGIAAVGLSATSTDRKVAVERGTSALGLAATGTAKHISVETGAATIGLAAIGKAVKLTTQTGVAAIGFVGTRTSTPGAHAVAGTCSVGFAATGTAKHIAGLAGITSVGLAATALERKISINVGKAAVGLAGTGLDNKRAVETGTSAIGLVATRTSVVPHVVQGRAFLGLAMFTQPGGCVTFRPSSGTTVYATATTGRPGSGTTTYNRATTARPNSGVTDDPC